LSPDGGSDPDRGRSATGRRTSAPRAAGAAGRRTAWTPAPAPGRRSR